MGTDERLRTQKQAILNDLQAGLRITTIDALQRHGVFRLSSIIHRLRKEGHDVKTELVKAPSGAIHGVYFLQQPAAKQTTIFDEISNRFFRRNNE